VDDEKTKALIVRAKAGDSDAFNELVRDTYQRVHDLALRLTGDVHDADDVVQETYVRAFRHLRRFRGDARFSTWLHRITANNASTLLGRRSKVRRRHDHLDDVIDLADYSADNDPQLRAEAAFTRTRLNQAIGLLPARLRSVLELREELGLSHREIAQRLNITESAAKVRLHRARERIRMTLAHRLLVEDAIETDGDARVSTPPKEPGQRPAS